MRVLVVDDEKRLAAALRSGLEAEGFAVDIALTGDDGLWLATENTYDAIILDIMLPGISGYEVCARLREAGNWTPILMLTAKDGEWDEAEALDTGADDYLVKPFALRELDARLQALARRANTAFTQGELRVADLCLDRASLRVSRAGVGIALPPIPLRLLEALMRVSPKVLSREELERAAWGDAPPDSDALRAHLHVLRNAVDKPFSPPLIRTLRGFGWQIAPADGTPP